MIIMKKLSPKNLLFCLINFLMIASCVNKNMIQSKNPVKVDKDSRPRDSLIETSGTSPNHEYDQKKIDSLRLLDKKKDRTNRVGKPD